MTPEHYALLALACYATGAGLALARLRWEGLRPAWQLLAVALGVLAQTAGIGVHCAHSHTHYFTSVTEILWLLAWSVGVNYLLILCAWRTGALGLLILPLNALLLAASFLYTYPGVPPVGGLDRQAFYPAHVLSAFLGYGFFLTACAASLLYLEAQSLLKRKLFSTILHGLPSLERLERSAAYSVWAGLALFTVAIALGGLLAHRQGLPGWYLEPKILAAEVTWLIFLVLAAGRAAGWLAGRSAARTILAGAALVAATILIGHPFREAAPPRVGGTPPAGVTR